MPVKGKQEAVVGELLWQDVGDLTVYGTSPEHGRVARLSLRYDGREWRFEGPGDLSFGRDGGCDIVVTDRKASRQHARVDRRRDKFVLADQSSNGTWVQFTGEAKGVILRREELMLRAGGIICFGHVLAEGEGAPVEFSCEWGTRAEGGGMRSFLTSPQPGCL